MSSPDRWNILYRGPLSSCNYACVYCPFAKTSNTVAELKEDAARLDQFVDWVICQKKTIGVLITPWGEAMIHKSYQKALARLSHASNVYRASIQTNLSGKLDWLENCDLSTIALWTTFHPSQTTIFDFLKKCSELDRMNVTYSVGMVGLKEDLPKFQELRRSLPDSVYLWANAYKDVTDYYESSDIDAFEKVDPQFRVNTKNYPSMGKPCNGGYSTFSIDGNGDVFRCHFIKQKIGNIYSSTFGSFPKRMSCTNKTCDCHIGYIHMPELNQDLVYGDGLLNRRVKDW